MITTVVCCICVTCTAVIASYGMSTVSTPAARWDGGGGSALSSSCMPFFLLFTSSCILVSAAYYLTIKISILAMRALVFGSQRKHRPISVAARRCRTPSRKGKDSKQPRSQAAAVEQVTEQPQRNAQVQTVPVDEIIQAEEQTCVSPWSFSDDEGAKKEEGSSNGSSYSVEIHGSMSLSPSSSDLEDDDSNEEEEQFSCLEEFDLDARPRGPPVPLRNERFTFFKVWTNVYGLAVGMFCIVYSLLLPNELSSFVFCSCLWAVGLYECVSKHSTCQSCCSRSSRRRTPGGSAGSRRQGCAACIWSFVRSVRDRGGSSAKKRQIFAELRHLQKQGHSPAADARRDVEAPQTTKAQRPPSHSALLMCLCMLLATGIGLKAAGGFISGKLWDGITLSDGETLHVATVLCSLLIPIVGVASIKNMQRTQDVRNTMELSVPVCSMGSLVCLLCIVLAGKESPWCSCMADFFWETATQDRYINAIPAVQDANWTAVFGHVPRNDNITVSASFLRHEPILSMFVMPFPLVCSVVAVVSCSRNDHIMDVAAAVFLAYSAKPFSISPDLVTQAQSQDRQHMASVLGGLSMGIGACMCICLACYRMIEPTEPLEESVLRRRTRRSALLLEGAADARGRRLG